VQTSRGALRGATIGGGIAAFLGIPYAAPPTGAGRFLPPRRLPAWEGVLDATRHGPACTQVRDGVLHGSGVRGELGRLFAFPDRFPQSEDCLRLSIWTPSHDPQARLPVLVYVHGGGYITKFGSVTGCTLTDGDRLAARGAVVITINHRLGVLGFLHLADVLGDAYASSGNAAIGDLAAALEWIQEEIGSFGGDPGRVMLFGESGGAMKICALLATRATRELCSGAMLQSGALTDALTPDAAATFTREFLDRLGLRPGEAPQLLSLPVERLLRAQASAMSTTDVRIGLLSGLGPVVDGELLEAVPFSSREAQPAAEFPLVLGTTAEEMTLFATASDLPTIPAEDVVRSTEETFARDAVTLAQRRLAVCATATYAYRFDWKTPAMGGRLGATHTLDLPFVFDTTDRAPVTAQPGATDLAATMSRSLVSFAAGGRPGGVGLPAWPPYGPPRYETLVFDQHNRLVDGQPADAPGTSGPRIDWLRRWAASRPPSPITAGS
jgi:para-nitrobenzyl esterase